MTMSKVIENHRKYSKREISPKDYGNYIIKSNPVDKKLEKINKSAAIIAKIFNLK